MQGIGTINVRHPSAGTWNKLVAEIQKRFCRAWSETSFEDNFRYPWMVETELWQPPDPTDTQDTSGYLLERKDSRAWKVNVGSGMVNDKAATIAYKRKGDPRGWIMPDDYDAPTEGRPFYDSIFVDRPLYDASIYPTDPPFLVMITPDVKNPTLGIWTTGAKNTIPLLFQTDSFKEKTLSFCSVVLTSDPGAALSFLPLPRAMKRYRVYVGKMPHGTPPPLGGGWLQLARIWLSRDKDAKDASTDQIYIEQKQFWNVIAMMIQPAAGLVGMADLLSGMGILGGMVSDTLNGIAMDSLYTAFWNC